MNSWLVERAFGFDKKKRRKEEIMKRLGLAIAAIVLGAVPPAFAGHIYINASAFLPCDGITASATSIYHTSGGVHPWVGWEFAAGADNCVFAHFWVPPDMPFPANITATAYLSPSGESDTGKKVWLWTGFTSGVIGANYNTITGLELVPNATSTIGPNPFPNPSYTGTVIETGAAGYSFNGAFWSKLEDAACTIDCLNMPVVMRLQRVTGNATCSADDVPWACCSGSGTGNCETNNDTTITVEVIGIDIEYTAPVS